jgi:CubicO group peptidase (beta-lactamase class C family)
MKWLFAVFAFFISAGMGAWAQPPSDKQLRKSLNELMLAQFPPDKPGCAVLVARQGAMIYQQASGMADLELSVPLKPDMVFNLASITKQFTAVAILQLAEQHKLSLSDTIQQYIPDFPAKGHPITIEHLLTHTSGIRDYLQIEYSGINMERWDFSPKQLIDSFKTKPIEFEPGTRFAYSNSGYYLLGYIIEKISGKQYQQYIEDYLLKPLGMTNTYFDRSNSLIPNRVKGYQLTGAQYRNADYWSPSILYAAGGLLSTTGDLLKWHNGLWSHQLISEQSLQQAMENHRLKDGTETGYGYGWYVRNANGIRSIEHQGGLPGFQTNELYYPEQQVFVTVLCNCGAINVNDISLKIAAVALNQSLQPDITVDDRILDQYLGTYTLSGNPNRSIQITRMYGRVVARLSDTEIVPLLFQTETKFQLKNLLNADGEFVSENGKVVKFIIRQNGVYEWIKGL